MPQRKCAVCSYTIFALEHVVFAQGDLMHLSCFRVLSSRETLRDARRIIGHSREVIEQARARVRRKRARHNPSD